jgi:uncharacterized lipoprotein YmbA
MRIIAKLISNIFIITFFIYFLVSCSSTSEKVKYYSLSLGTTAKTTKNNYPNFKNRPQVTIVSIQLAKFLRQQGIIMQIGDYEINVASYHRWAEPLDEAIAKNLAHILNTKSKHYQFERKIRSWNKNTKFNLRLEFYNFHVTDNKSVLVNGQYWFYHKDKTLIVNKSFNISEKLTQDGYLHSIEKLKIAINKLSNEIINSLADTL